METATEGETPGAKPAGAAALLALLAMLFSGEGTTEPAATRSGQLTATSNAGDSPAMMSPGGSGGGALTLVSRGLRVLASSASEPAADATDADYNSEWRSAGVPATLTLDLSTLPSSARERMLLVWYNDATYGYDHALAGQAGYNNPGAYTIEGHTAVGGGAAPSSGWVVLATVSRNTKHSLQHLLELGGYSWLRLNFSAADGSRGSDDIALNLDLYSVSGSVSDGWLFAGDSITANCMGHRHQNGLDSPAFGTQISADNPPPQENAGMPGWTSSDRLGDFAGWVAAFPGRYVTINLGTNDAAAGISASQFHRNLSQLVRTVLDAGKLPLLPTIPYATEATHKANIPALNSRIRDLYAAYPALVPGPDLYAYFQAHPNLIANDGVHLSDAGCVAYRQQWANTARGRVY